MNQYTIKNLLFFQSLYSALNFKALWLIMLIVIISQGLSAQTDSLAPNPDTLSVSVPIYDTLKTDSSAILSLDTSVSVTDTIAGISDTSSLSAINADTLPKPIPPPKLFAQFDTTNLMIKQGEIISKLLQVINGTKKEQIFAINLTYPSGWKALTNTERTYTLAPGDTFFIPVRIVPLGKILGNTRYLIFAYIINENKVPVAGANFLAEKQKIIDWKLDVLPDEKLYLLNNEDYADFSVSLFNTGNEQIELFLDMTTYRKDRMMLLDTSNNIIKKPVYTVLLQSFQDTSLSFRLKYSQGLRNFKLIDTEDYLPLSKGEYQKYSLFVKSKESAFSSDGSVFKGKRIDLIRLTDNSKVNRYGFSAFPLTVEANISNILGYLPLMNVMLRGSTILKNGAVLNYNATTYFSTYFAGTRFLTGSSFIIGYYEKRFNVQIGNVGGGFGGGAGKGISGNYFINNRNTVGGFFTRGPRFFTGKDYSFGVNHSFATQIFRIQTDYSHNVFSSSQLSSDYLRANSSFNINSKNAIGVGGMFFRNSYNNSNNPIVRNGYGYNASYSSKISKMLTSSVSYSYATRYAGIGGTSGGSTGINHSSNLTLKKNREIRISNQYQRRDSISIGQGEQVAINNSVFFNNFFKKMSASPSIFYNFIRINNYQFHSRGITLNYSKFDLETNRLIGVNFTAGYNKSTVIPGLKDFFFFRSFFIFKYRVWSGNVRYTYGPVAPSDLSFLGGVYPQTLGSSLNYQYQFKNPHFILNNNLTYNYINRFSKSSIGYTPQLYYFTNSGWRFYIQPGYYLTISKSSNPYNFTRNSEDDKIRQTSVSQSIIVNAGVKKDFGIPIPWVKTRYPTIIFFSFLDHNGNNIQDEGEVPLENIVVKLGEWDVLTNEKGKASLKNIYGDSTYSFSAFSLVDLKGYFPNIPANITAIKDSTMLVPFVKGIKVHGNVYLDREKITPGVEKPLDLTGIKITAINGKALHTLTDGKGDFSFYVPFGKYTISMDEKVLGDRFTILQNNIELELDQKTESIFLTFYIVEKRRKITVKKFNGNGERIKDSDTTITPKTKTIEELKKEETLKKKPNEQFTPETPGKAVKVEGAKSNGSTEKVGNGNNTVKGGNEKGNNSKLQTPNSNLSNEPIDKSKIKFKVQIGAYNSDIPNNIVEKIKSLPNIKESRTDEGLIRYTSGEFSDYESAQVLRQELINKGISTDTTFVIIIADYKGRVFSADEAKELLKD